MEFTDYSIFIVLGAISFSITGFHLWGLIRASKRHNESPLGILSKKETAFPNKVMICGAVLYVLITIVYIIFPPFLHH
jgi:hypothetical protein